MNEKLEKKAIVNIDIYIYIDCLNPLGLHDEQLEMDELNYLYTYQQKRSGKWISISTYKYMQAGITYGITVIFV